MLKTTHKKVFLSLLSIVTLTGMMSCSKCGMGADANKAPDATKTADANSSSAVSKADYIAKVDAICTKNKETMKSQVAALAATMKSDASPAQKTRLGSKVTDKGADLMEEAIKEIEAVPMPTEGAEDLKKMYAELHQSIQMMRDGSKMVMSLADAMDKAADPETAEEGKKEIEELTAKLQAVDGKAIQESLKEQAMKYGFKVCGQK